MTNYPKPKSFENIQVTLTGFNPSNGKTYNFFNKGTLKQFCEDFNVDLQGLKQSIEDAEDTRNDDIR